VCGARLVEASMQETLAELFMLQGDFAAAEALLERSITALRTLRSGFNEAQAQLTLGRYRLLASESARASRLAAEAFRASQEICARIGDRRGQMAARLWLVETHLVLNEMAKARRLLEKIRAEIEAPIGRAHLPLLGHLCELKGRIALSEGRIAEAIRCLDQAVSICELTGHRYRAGVAGFHLSRAYLEAGQVTRAREVIEQAAVIFSEMEAQPMLAQTAALRFEESQVRTTRIHQPSAAEIALSGLTRLAEAGHSQELLLHELARLLDRDFSATPVIIYQRLADGRLIPIFYQGCDEQQAISLGRHLKKVKSGKLKSGQSAAPAGSLYQLVEDDTLMLYLGEHSAELSSSLVALLNHQIRLALEVSRLRPRTPSLPAYPSLPSSLLPSLPDLICQSTSMRRVAEQVLELQGSHLTVLITGQSGTGKELIARAIHDLSSRAAQPFIAFNCASTPRELVEAQLFGYRKGAFTGANQDHPGMIRAAAGGTLLLDEIGDLPRDIQLKLLRFLQEGEIQPLGESRPARVDVRVIAATNRDLERMIAAGEFREDLWYRLNVVELHLPPLRERREEIPLLIEHFLNRYTAKAGKEGITVAPEALEVMMQYDWPGNVRQLENEIQRLVALKPAGTEITAQQLNPRITKQVAAVSASSQHKTLAEIEREAVLAAMTRHRGNRTRVAEELGISRPTLRAMIERHKIVLPPKLKQ
jgi:transcriptional regulator with PAS, ATPase and Fis domain